MTRCRQPRADPGQRAWEIKRVVADQAIGELSVALMVAIAGDDHVIAERPDQPVQMGDHRFGAPFEQAFVEASHALAATSGQQ